MQILSEQAKKSTKMLGDCRLAGTDLFLNLRNCALAFKQSAQDLQPVTISERLKNLAI